jgi:hypothetical protein
MEPAPQGNIAVKNRPIRLLALYTAELGGWAPTAGLVRILLQRTTRTN